MNSYVVHDKTPVFLVLATCGNIFMSFSEKQQNSRSTALKQILSTKISGLAGLPVLLWWPIVWCFADCWANNARKAMFSNQKEGLGCTESMDIYYSAQTLENVIVHSRERSQRTARRGKRRLPRASDLFIGLWAMLTE